MTKLDRFFERMITDKVIEVAKKMLTKGLSLEDISELTELDIETIKELQEAEVVGEK